MKDPNLWPTHKGRARGKNARHRAMIRAQRAGKTVHKTARRPARYAPTMTQPDDIR